MSRFICCLLYILLVIPLMIAYIICAIIAAIFGNPEKCSPILERIKKLSECCSGKRG